MKRGLILCLGALLVAGSAIVSASARSSDDEQETARRARLASPGFLGVELEEVTQDTAQRLKLREERGALITGIVSDSGAAKAGLKRDDVIIKWNGEPIESAMELSRHLRETPAGRTVRLTVVREGRETDVEVKLGEHSGELRRLAAARARKALEAARESREARAAARAQLREAARAARDEAQVAAREARERMHSQEREMHITVGDRARLGIQIQSMSPQLAEYFGLKGRTGALVVFVYADSPAAKAGLRAGDVVLSIAGVKVDSPRDVMSALRSKSEGPVEIKVMRDKQERSFTVQIEKEGRTSWMVGPDWFDEMVIEPGEAVIAMPEVALAIPKMSLALPKIVLPKIALPPIELPAIEPMAPMELKIAPMAIPSMKLMIPKMKMPKINIPKMMFPPLRMPMRITVMSETV